MTRSALITGVGGQDGSLLAELLLEHGYDVFGVTRDDGAHENLRGIVERIRLFHSDLLDPTAIEDILHRSRPTEVYNLASPSFSPASWDTALTTVSSGAITVVALLEAIRRVDPQIRLFQASSSEMFGAPVESPQTEWTPLRPLTPYGAAKACAHFLVQSYRHRYGLFACSGILFNHESERRSVRFLPRKVANGAAGIALGLQEDLQLGNLDARRDWGSARDYVRAMWQMLQHSQPDDYVIASGNAHSVKELVAYAFERVGLDWTRYVRVDPGLMRREDERQGLVGNASKAREVLGWRPTTSFAEIVYGLVDVELQRLVETSPRAREARAAGESSDGEPQ